MFPASEVKNGQPLECAYSIDTSALVRRYLIEHRIWLLGDHYWLGDQESAFWLSRQGKPLAAKQIRERINKHTEDRFGLSRDQEDIAALYKQLTFSDITMITLAEGEISELHVGLKGTMNALFLKDLAQKTGLPPLSGPVLMRESGAGLCPMAWAGS